MPVRVVNCPPLPAPDPAIFAEFHEGTQEREASTMMAFARMLSKLLKNGANGG